MIFTHPPQSLHEACKWSGLRTNKIMLYFHNYNPGATLTLTSVSFNWMYLLSLMDNQIFHYPESKSWCYQELLMIFSPDSSKKGKKGCGQTIAKFLIVWLAHLFPNAFSVGHITIQNPILAFSNDSFIWIIHI